MSTRHHDSINKHLTLILTLSSLLASCDISPWWDNASAPGDGTNPEGLFSPAPAGGQTIEDSGFIATQPPNAEGSMIPYLIGMKSPELVGTQPPRSDPAPSACSPWDGVYRFIASVSAPEDPQCKRIELPAFELAFEHGYPSEAPCRTERKGCWVALICEERVDAEDKSGLPTKHPATYYFDERQTEGQLRAARMVAKSSVDCKYTFDLRAERQR